MQKVVSHVDKSNLPQLPASPTQQLPIQETASATHKTASTLINSPKKDAEKGLKATPQPSSFFNHPYVKTAGIVLGALTIGALIGTANVLQGGTSSGSTSLQLEPINPLLPQARTGGTCYSYAFPTGITGTMTTASTRGLPAIVSTASGNATVSTWANTAGTDTIQVAVNARNGTGISGPTTVSIPSDGTVATPPAGARFGNGEIGICYGSYPSSGVPQLQFLTLSPDGLTTLSRKSSTNTTGSSAPQITCDSLFNGNIQTTILSTNSVTLAEVAPTNSIVPGTLATIPLPSGTNGRGISFGQYPTGEKLFVLNDPTAGLQAYLLNNNAIVSTSNLVVSGSTVNSGAKQSTVNTQSGPITFFRTTTNNLYMARVNPTSGAVTTAPLQTTGTASFAMATSSYDPNYPNQPEYLAVVLLDGSSVSMQVINPASLQPIGCSIPVGTAAVTVRPSVIFYPGEQKSLRVIWPGVNSFDVKDFNLDAPPTFISGPTGSQTLYSTSPTKTTYSYPVIGNDVAGYPLSIYLDSNITGVTTSGNNIVIDVTPDMVGTSFDVDYKIENVFGEFSPNQTLSVTIPDRAPVVNNFTLPAATAGSYYAVQLPANTFPPDVDGNPTQSSITFPPQLTGLTYDSSTRLISGYPLNGVSLTQPQTFSVTASNTELVKGAPLLSSSNIQTLTVNPSGQTTNQVQKIGNNRNVNVAAGIANNQTFTGLDFQVQGVPFDQLTLTITPINGVSPPDGLSLTGNVVSYTPVSGASGTISYGVAASYNGGSQSLPIIVTNSVYSADQARPVLTNALPSLTAKANAPFSTTIPLSGWYTPLTGVTIASQQVSVLDDGEWLTDATVDTNGNIILKGTPGDDAKSPNVQIIATDSQGLQSAPVSQPIQVIGGNANSTLTSNPLTLATGIISLAGISIKAGIAMRILTHLIPDKLEKHKDERWYSRWRKTFTSSAKVLLGSHAKAREEYHLNFWGGKIRTIPLDSRPNQREVEMSDNLDAAMKNNRDNSKSSNGSSSTNSSPSKDTLT